MKVTKAIILGAGFGKRMHPITKKTPKIKILFTWGGILNASRQFKKKIFFVLNPDTLWRRGYKNEFKKLEKVYLKNKKPTMLLVSKNRSYDRSFKGDFNLNSKNEILRQKNNKFIFTGAQIINRSVFKKRKIKPFSMNKVWDDLIKNKELLGVTSRQKFFHINNYKIYKKLSKKVIG